ncbi:MAG: DUF6624 domain-containing protein [Ekhidna sp.]
MKKIMLLVILITSDLIVIGQSKEELDSLRQNLETIFMKDQTFRKIYLEAEKKLGRTSPEMEYFWEIVEAQDKVLEEEVVQIIENYGWLGISQVGRLANTTIWAVLQHGSVDSKRKYAHLLKASVLKNESQPIMYARLIDRMRINSDQLQVYGTQVDNNSFDKPTFFDIERPQFVNQRRKKIGLPKLEDYARQNGIEWSVIQKEE